MLGRLILFSGTQFIIISVFLVSGSVMAASDDQTVRFWGNEMEWKEQAELLNKTSLNAMES